MIDSEQLNGLEPNLIWTAEGRMRQELVEKIPKHRWDERMALVHFGLKAFPGDYHRLTNNLFSSKKDTQVKLILFGLLIALAVPLHAGVIITNTFNGEPCRSVSYADGIGTTTVQLGSRAEYVVGGFAGPNGTCYSQASGQFWVGPTEWPTFLEFSEGLGYREDRFSVPASASWSVDGVAFANCAPNCFSNVRRFLISTPSPFDFRIQTSASRNAFDGSIGVVQITIRAYEEIPNEDTRVPPTRRYLALTAEEIPEPSTFAMAAGVLGLMAWSRKANSKR